MTDLSQLKIPRHIAIIMDGNGRWAKKKHRPRTFGHKRGAEVVEQILEDCNDLGVQYLTVYAFSTENWARPLEEVKVIMGLFKQYLTTSIEKCNRNNVRGYVIGERSRLNPDLIEAIENFENKTSQNTGIRFIVAINYGSRDEILRGVRQLAQDAVSGSLNPSQISEETISGYLDTADFPDPDLLIRTSGEERLSNFLMWQLAYAEFYFTDVLWPDFNKEELQKAIAYYNGRDRRYGGV